MKLSKIFTLLIALSTFLTACIKPTGCPPETEIEWVDLLMMNGVKYQYNFPDEPDKPLTIQVKQGNPVGEIKYKMADNACSDYQMKNGDAAYLEPGTIVYEVKGYPASLMVLANEKVYVANQKQNAKTIGELYPIKGLVKNIYIESTEDGSRIQTFSPLSVEKFLDEWLQLKLEDYRKLEKKNSFEGERVFLEIELNNGVSFRQLYWSDTNTFAVGAEGNDTIQIIIQQEQSLINQ